MTDELGLHVDLDTCDRNPQNLTRALDICRVLGADRLHVYSSVSGDVKEELKQAADDFRQGTPLCADYGVRIPYENHEYETPQTAGWRTTFASSVPPVPAAGSEIRWIGVRPSISARTNGSRKRATA